MTDATETNSSTALTVPKLTAAQIEKDCPAQLQDLAKDLRQGLEKLYEQKTLVVDQEIAVKKLIADVKALCDDGGFKAFREMFFPKLGKSRVYELLAIGTNKKSVQEIRASNRKRQAKHRENKAEATLSVQGAPKEVDAVAATSTATGQNPEPKKPWSALASEEAMRVFTVHVLGLYKGTNKRPPEHFSATTIPVEIIAQLGRFFTALENIKKSKTVEAARAVLPGSASAEQLAEDIKGERAAQDAEELCP